MTTGRISKRVVDALACPAGNHEGDAKDEKQWADRVDLMRDLTIYFRNNPSVLFWEASNSSITLQHMLDMREVKKQWDPNGGRFAGTRSWDTATESAREYQSPMDVPANSALMPSWDAEYARAEAPRRVWDKFTPVPDRKGEPTLGGYSKLAPGNQIVDYPVDDFRLNSSEDLALNNARKYWDRYKRSALVAPEADRAKNGVMVGGAKIIYADSNSHGRMANVDCARVSGVLDAVRLPKESYHALTVAHSDTPAIHILGHWNYPDGTTKPMWVVSNTDKVHLVVSDESGKVVKDYGTTTWEGANLKAGDKNNRYAFKFDSVAFVPGKVQAIGLSADKEVVRTAVETAGAPAALKLTPLIGPANWRADGSDIAMVDIEVVDAKGRRCPLDYSPVDFKYDGPAGKFLGGYNSGVENSTYKDSLLLECGINRVLIKATRSAGKFTLTVTRKDLPPASITLTAEPASDDNGLAAAFPRRYGFVLGSEPLPPGMLIVTNTSGSAGTGAKVTTDQIGVMREFAYTGTKGESLNPPLPAAHIEHKAKNGSQIYVDKDWKFETLPDYLVGGDYVQAFQRDATENSSTDQIQFFTNKKCYIYQLVDAANAMPVHNNNEQYKWTKLADTVTINGRKHNIYKSKLMAEGVNGYFASNGKGIDLAAGCNQYVVFAVAAP